MDVPRSLVSTLKLQQQAFFEEVKEAGEHQAPHVKRWPEPTPKPYYDVAVGSPSGYVLITPIPNPWVRLLRAPRRSCPP